MEPAGCFNDKHGDRALPEMIANLRDKIDWNDMQKTVEECACIAYEGGYMVMFVFLLMIKELQLVKRTKVKSLNYKGTFCSVNRYDVPVSESDKNEIFIMHTTFLHFLHTNF